LQEDTLTSMKGRFPSSTPEKQSALSNTPERESKASKTLSLFHGIQG